MPNRNRGIPWTVLAFSVAVLGIVAALTYGIAVSKHGLDSESTPLLTSIVAFGAAMVPSVFAAYKSDAAHRQTDRIKRDTDELKNGALTDKLKTAIRQVNKETEIVQPSSPLTDSISEGGDATHG